MILAFWSASLNSDQVAGIFITVAVSYPLGLPLLISTSKIGLSKTYPSHFGVVLLIFGWIGPWHIPACHTAHFHGLSLDGADAQIFGSSSSASSTFRSLSPVSHSEG